MAVTADTALAEAYAYGGTDNRDDSSFFSFDRVKGTGPSSPPPPPTCSSWRVPGSTGRRA